MSCISPVVVYDKLGRKTNSFPCRQCIPCRLVRQSAYEFSCVMARQQAFRNGLGCSFVTLTYTDDTVPIVHDVGSNFYMTLVKRDFQNFYKRLRRSLDYDNFPVKQIQHFSCGEYGDRFDRPHYHSLIFGLDSVSAEKYVAKSWKLGLTDVGSLRAGGIRYVVDYVVKNKTGKLAEMLYDNIGIERPFLSHSVRLGNDYFFDDFNYDDSDFTYFRNGRRVPLPSSFRHKIDRHRHFEFFDYDGEREARSLGMDYDSYKFLESVKLAESKVVFDRLNSIPTFDVDFDVKSRFSSVQSVYTPLRRQEISCIVDSSLSCSREYP